MADVLFNSDPGILTLSGEGDFSLYILSEPGIITLSGEYSLSISGPPPSWNPNLDYTYYCNNNSVDGVGQGVGVINLSGLGNRLEVYIPLSPGIINLSGYGLTPGWITISSSPGVISFSGKGNPWIIPINNSWVKWSKIGSADFTIDKSNESGERPMPWSGWVYGGKKHNDSVVIYGQNGIAVMKPSGVLWSLKGLLKIGILSKKSFCGTDHMHYFITKDYTLYEFGETLKSLGYSKHLSVLSSKTVMNFDESLGIVYISDGIYGFVYANGLGTGPINISGLGWKNGNFYSTAPADIVTPVMSCQTDIIDFGTRRVKTISHIDFGISVSGSLKVAVDYRYRVGEPWHTTPWVKMDSNGIAHVLVSGVDFKFNWKLLSWEYVEIPEIKVYGL